MTIGVTIGFEHIGKRVRVIRQDAGGQPIGTLGIVRLVRDSEIPFVTIETDASHSTGGRWFRFAPSGYLELVDEPPVAKGGAAEAAEAAEAASRADYAADYAIYAAATAANLAREGTPDVGPLVPDLYVWADEDGELSETMTLPQAIEGASDEGMVTIYRLVPIASRFLRWEESATPAEREALK